MKDKIQKSLKGILSNLYNSPEININQYAVNIQDNKDKEHGDLASNIALILAKPLKRKPLEIANEIIQQFNLDEDILKVEVAGPGFINFFLSKNSHGEVLKTIDFEKEHYGKIEPQNKRVLIEYVSSNPTGPLHVGHGRGAVFGSVLSSLLKEAGFEVDEEYYINDFGRQMNILSVSLWIRYAQLFDIKVQMIKNGYQGGYMKVIAENLKTIKKDEFVIDSEIISSIFAFENENDELLTDQIIDGLKTELGNKFFFLRDFALQEIISQIKEDLSDFRVNHNKWFSESSLYQNGNETQSKVEETIKNLHSNSFVYEKDDAVWFKSSDFGDDKDRVLKRGNGEYTYFASDVAYHLDKYERGYDRVINIWGSDHHGYIPRVKAAMEASQKDKNKLEVVFIQFANLIRDGKKVTMSTRSGEFITLRELI